MTERGAHLFVMVLALVRPVVPGFSARRRHSRSAAVACILGICMCAVAVHQLRGTQRQAELEAQQQNSLLNRFAEQTTATRKAQLGMVSNHCACMVCDNGSNPQNPHDPHTHD